jgi:hypothetical protein
MATVTTAKPKGAKKGEDVKVKPYLGLRRAYIYEEDIIPVTKGKKPTKMYKITWSRQAIGRFIQEQMFWQGYFVPVSYLRKVQGSQKRKNGKFAGQRTIKIPGGTRKTKMGVWAVNQLAYRAEIGSQTILNMMNGAYKRSPYLFSLLKVFKALKVELVGVPAKDSSVAMIVKGW